MKLLLTISKRVLFYFLSVSILSGCEEFVGFDYSADKQQSFTRVQGNIKNIHTGEDVFEASVTVGDRMSKTDLAGNYLIFHGFGVDEERDKPVNFSVTAENFYPYYAEILLAPYINKIDIELTYAAPLILNYYSGWHYSSDNTRLFVVQAEIRDYQGIDTIDSVRITFQVTDDTVRIPIFRTMERIRQIDRNTAFYQQYVDPDTFRPFRLLEVFDINVQDNEGYTAFRSKGPYPQPLLFDPVLP